jgi:hypothetical protein
MTVLNPLLTTNGEASSVFIGYFSASICYILYPAMFIYVLRQSMETIKSKKFMRKWGNIFDQIKLNKGKLPLFYNVVFCLRRFLFTMIMITFTDNPGQQIQLMLLMNIFSLIYVGTAKPKIEKGKNRMELMNEVNVNTCSCIFMTFTDWADGPVTQEFYGWIMVGVLSFNVTTNLSIVYLNIGKQIWLFVVKYYRIIKNKLTSKKSV